jgi:hypothetical protein
MFGSRENFSSGALRAPERELRSATRLICSDAR